MGFFVATRLGFPDWYIPSTHRAEYQSGGWMLMPPPPGLEPVSTPTLLSSASRIAPSPELVPTTHGAFSAVAAGDGATFKPKRKRRTRKKR